MEWNFNTFNELTAAGLYNILKLRVDVFVVEQDCPYPELDNLDQQCIHLTCVEEGEIIAYSRLVPADAKYDIPSIGRVVVQPEARGRGLAKELLNKSIQFILTEWQAYEIQLQGQYYLKDFYESFGFNPISDVYDEDGIPHLDMKYVKS